VAVSIDKIPPIDGLTWNGDSLYFTSILGPIFRYQPTLGDLNYYVTSTAVAVHPLGITNDGKAGDLLFVNSLPNYTGILMRVPPGSATMPVSMGAVTGMTLTFPNDTKWYSPKNAVVRASDGMIYVTDPGYQTTTDPLNAIYRVTPSTNATGTVTTIDTFPNGDRPNGIALSPNTDILYVSLTQDLGTGIKPSIVKYAVKDDGTVNPKTTFVDLPEDSQPDGLAVDSDGNVYVATATLGVVVYAPDNTKWGAIAMPVGVAATNVAFGGDGLMTLYIGTDGGPKNPDDSSTYSGLYSAPVKVAGLQQ